MFISTANQTHNETSSPPSQDGAMKQPKTINAGKDWELLYTSHCELPQPLWRTIWKFLKIFRVPRDSAIPPRGASPKQMTSARHLHVFNSALIHKTHDV
jgi:hypothetical protein